MSRIGPKSLGGEPQVPNLDAMNPEELWALWAKWRYAKRSDAVALVGPRKGYTVLVGNLAGYASNKATAMNCRIRGDIPAAQVYESICESIYSELPEDCRW